jgi:hypothetical protein
LWVMGELNQGRNKPAPFRGDFRIDCGWLHASF